MLGDYSEIKQLNFLRETSMHTPLLSRSSSLKNVYAALFAVSLALAPLSQATAGTLYDLTLTGTINASDSAYLSLGTTVTTTVRFETGVAPELSTPSQAIYANRITQFSLSIPSIVYSGSVSGNFGQLSVLNSGGSDGFRYVINRLAAEYTFVAANPALLPLLPTSTAVPADDMFGDFYIEEVYSNLFSSNAALFSSTALPTSFSLSDFDQNKTFGITLFSQDLTFGPRHSAGGGWTNLSIVAVQPAAPPVQSVPEPGTVSMLLVGLLGLFGVSRWRRI
jgi:hypothetical protein